MAFTFSHPALILPFANKLKYFSISGLITGSIVPDFEYFLRMKKETSYYSHSWGGIFYFDLPVGLLICFIFHFLIRQSLILNLPASFQLRFKSYYSMNWFALFKKNWIKIAVSILIGAVLHILWDLSIHNLNHFFYHNDPDLNEVQNVLLERKYYYILWSVNSIVGAIAVYVSLIRVPKEDTELINSNIENYWVSFMIFTIIFSGIRIFFGSYLSFDDIIVSITSSSLIALILTSLLDTIPEKIIYPK